VECPFCAVAGRSIPAAIVFEDSRTVVFLDTRPLFPGHCLVIPEDHVETLLDVPDDGIGPLFSTARAVCGAMETALGADGSFMAVNNRVSQSVPHLHIHVVPRKRKDGLKGFFWPRTKYRDDEEMEGVRKKLAGALA
jgi:histidine triad (HIT) family protein